MSARRGPPRGLPRRARVGACLLLWAALAAGGPPSGAGSAAADDVQPAPPRIFFSQPDEPTRREIEDLVDNSSGDVSKAAAAREALVRRFGLWSVPVLADRVEAGANEAAVRSGVLTLASLRRAYGPSQHLWPAIRPVVSMLSREGSDPWRRAFAALSLGSFYGPATARRGPASREGTEAGAARAREALAAGDAALVFASGDANAPVAAAASLAIAKIGSPSVAKAWSERTGGPPPVPEARVADLLAAGLLPVDATDRILAGLQDPERRIRAAAALAVSCWAVSEGHGVGAGGLSAAAAVRAARYDAALRPERNSLLRQGDTDGAEALFARAMLSLLSPRLDPWDQVFEVATTTTEMRAATAAAQALLVAPEGHPVRARIAEAVTRPAWGRSLREPVVASFLLSAGGTGSPEGVRACRDFLRDRSREPRGRPEYDVRYHAAVALVKALTAGRVPADLKAEAVGALAEAVRATLGRAEGRDFRSALADLVGPYEKQFAADRAARLPEDAPRLLALSWRDPDALLAADETDLVVDRLNDVVWTVFGLDAVGKAASGPLGARAISRDEVPLRLLQAWLDRDPYFTRIDLDRERGRVPAPAVPAGGDAALEIDR